MNLLEVLQELISSYATWFINNGFWFAFLLIFLDQFILISYFSQGFFAIILMGFFAYSGYFSLIDVITVSLTASILGTNLQFFIARKYGRSVLRALNRFPRFVNLEAIQQIHVKRETIVASYIAGQLRGPMAFMAGASKTSVGRWLLYSTIGVIVWIAMSITLGWGAAHLFNGNLAQALLWVWNVNQNLLNWIFLVLTLVLLAFMVRSLQKRHKG